MGVGTSSGSAFASRHSCAPPAQTPGSTFDVQMTSRRWMFIHVSHCTMWPLYVSPFFSSISCRGAAGSRQASRIPFSRTVQLLGGTRRQWARPVRAVDGHTTAEVTPEPHAQAKSGCPTFSGQLWPIKCNPRKRAGGRAVAGRQAAAGGSAPSCVAASVTFFVAAEWIHAGEPASSSAPGQARAVMVRTYHRVRRRRLQQHQRQHGGPPMASIESRKSQQGRWPLDQTRVVCPEIPALSVATGVQR